MCVCILFIFFLVFRRRRTSFTRSTKTTTTISKLSHQVIRRTRLKTITRFLKEWKKIYKTILFTFLGKKWIIVWDFECQIVKKTCFLFLLHFSSCWRILALTISFIELNEWHGKPEMPRWEKNPMTTFSWTINGLHKWENYFTR